MRMAQLDENSVCVVLSSPLDTAPEGLPSNIVLVEDGDEVLGKRHLNGEWIEVPEEPVVEPIIDISPRQFFQGLYKRELISRPEAVAALRGTIPPVMQSLMEQLPEDARDDAEFLIVGAKVFERANPVAELIRVLFGWTVEQADDFWRFAATL